MTYTITQNPAHNGLEITFDGKPSAAVCEALKSLRFRWHNVKKLWYGRADENTARSAIDAAAAGAEQPGEKPAETTPLPVRDPTLMAKLRDVLNTVYENKPEMVRYCLAEVAEIVELSDGTFTIIEKQPIKKDFCFGYSTYGGEDDYTQAGKMAAHARTSEEHFIHENMKKYREEMGILNTGTWHNQDYMIGLTNAYPTKADANSPYKNILFIDLRTMIDALGGSAVVEDLPGSTVTIRGVPVRICDADDLNRIRDGYQRAMNAHERKVRAYLKRYGLSKVNSWTYWQDE